MSRLTLKAIAKSLIPPILLTARTKLLSRPKSLVRSLGQSPDKQDTDLYWDENYADVLENWGRDTVWQEIQLLFSGLRGRVLDIACGTGPTIDILNKFPGLEVHGFDLSDVLIRRAIAKGISADRVRVGDATNAIYGDGEFDYSFSIGSIEHFTEDGITKFLANAARYTKRYSFHMLPANKNGVNKGWEKTSQSYFNNSVAWWMEKFSPHFKEVIVVDSAWAALDQKGKWFICHCNGDD